MDEPPGDLVKNWILIQQVWSGAESLSFYLAHVAGPVEEQGFRVRNYSNPACFSLICTNSETAVSLKHPTALAPLAFLAWPESNPMQKSPSRGGVTGDVEFLGISVSQ